MVFSSRFKFGTSRLLNKNLGNLKTEFEYRSSHS